MESKSKLMFLVLTLCGTACILASLGAMGYLYDKHAVQLAIPHEGPGLPTDARFAIFVGLPCLSVLIAGAALVVVGIKIGREDDRP